MMCSASLISRRLFATTSTSACRPATSLSWLLRPRRSPRCCNGGSLSSASAIGPTHTGTTDASRRRGAHALGATRSFGDDSNSNTGVRIWEYRVADEQAPSSASASASASDDAQDGDDGATTSKKKIIRTKATLYTPASSAKNGWTTLNTTLGSTTDATVTSSGGQSVPSSDKANTLDKSQSPRLLDNLADKVERHVIRHFLPAGYPTSVAPGYRNYVLYCFAANTCGSAAMVLSTQTLLLAVGVGSSEAAPLAAGLNWVMKDGIGQLGGILFASRLGSAATGSSIDSDPKRWRVASAISMDGATWLEILSPLFPGYFLPIASVANIGKNIGFLTASASRAAIHNALALKTNLGDVTAKAGSQSIAASLAGTVLGVSLSPIMHGEVANVAVGFALLSVFHQYCTYKSLRFVHLRSLNRHRMNLIMEDFVRSYIVARGVAGLEATYTIELNEDKESVNGAFNQSSSALSPSEVAQIEQFLPFISNDETKQWLVVGCKLNELFSNQMEFDTVRQNCIGKREGYLLNCDFDYATPAKGDGGSSPLIRLTYLENANGLDIIRGMLHAHILKAILQKEIMLPSEAPTSRELIKASHGIMAESSDAFMEALEKGGWDTDMESIQVEAGSAVRLRIEKDH